jgi:hypothetical protein
MTNLFTCPKGHNSTESDYCSECGAKIAGGAEVKAEVLSTSAFSSSSLSSLTCPDCLAPHESDSGDFCEICGYNFSNGKHGELAVPNIPVSLSTTIPEIQSELDHPEEESGKSPAKEQILTIWWELTATVDPSLRHPESPEPPTTQSPLTFSLKPGTNLIGRSNSVRAIYPDIPLDFDNAVSHRHAILSCQSDGTLTLRDIGSSNGTVLRGEELKPMIDVLLQDGDEFTLGHWTRITIKAL